MRAIVSKSALTLKSQLTRCNIRMRTHTVAAMPESQVIQRYLQQYIDVVCKNSGNPAVCVDEMMIPEPEIQIKILQQFDMLVNTFPIVDGSPSLQSAMFQLLVQQDEDLLHRMLDLLNSHAVLIHIIQETLKEIHG